MYDVSHDVRALRRLVFELKYYMRYVPTRRVVVHRRVIYFFRPFGGSFAGGVRPALPAPTGGVGPVGVVGLLNFTNFGNAMTN